MTGASGAATADVSKAWNKMDLHSKQFEAMIADPAARAVALDYLPFCAVVPLLGVPAWQLGW